MSESDEICITCPHCKELIYILKSEINCNVFRHGIYKHNLQQMDPHAPKEMCEKLKNEDLIIGCGKPFTLVFNKEDNTFKSVVCDYI